MTSHRDASPVAATASSLRDLLHDCVASGLGEEQGCLEDAYRLFATMTPATVPPPAGFAAMIAARAWESAALALLGPRAVFMVSRGATGNALASIVDASGNEVTAEAASAALALLAAHVASILGDPEHKTPGGAEIVAPLVRPH